MGTSQGRSYGCTTPTALPANSTSEHSPTFPTIPQGRAAKKAPLTTLTPSWLLDLAHVPLVAPGTKRAFISRAEHRIRAQPASSPEILTARGEQYRSNRSTGIGMSSSTKGQRAPRFAKESGRRIQTQTRHSVGLRQRSGQVTVKPLSDFLGSADREQKGRAWERERLKRAEPSRVRTVSGRFPQVNGNSQRQRNNPAPPE